MMQSVFKPLNFRVLLMCLLAAAAGCSIRKVAVNRTILMVEHNLSVVSTLSDHITVLARGEVLAEGDYAHVSRHPAVVEAYMGTAVG